MGCPLPGKEEQRSKPLLFVGMLAVLGAQVSAKDEYKVEAYDCSQPMNIKLKNWKP